MVFMDTSEECGAVSPEMAVPLEWELLFAKHQAYSVPE